MYCNENFRTKPCPHEKRGLACDYLMICPFRHATDVVDFDEKMSYSEKTANYYRSLVKHNLNNILEKIKSLQLVIDYHLCSECDSELKRKYNILKCCEKILCDGCADKKEECCGNKKEIEKISIKL